MDDNDIYEHSTSLRLGLRAGLRTADVVTGCSQFTLDDAVARFGLRPADGVVVPNGVDLRDRAEPVPLELPFSRFVLAYGRMVEKKGFDLLIDGFRRLADRHPDVSLVIGGDGSARPALTEQIERLGLTGRVILPGRLSRGQVTWATRHASAFVLPSRVEPFGIVVLEAMDAGLPVVVSSHGGAGEIVRHGIDGLVVDPFDLDALADPGATEGFIAAGRARSSEFSWEAITDRYVALYGKAMATANSRHPLQPA
jgi:glycogen synthase